MKRTISGQIGKGSVGHNNREFIAENVDRSRIDLNITLIKENIRDVYTELFGDALAAYNAKQKRKDRQIRNYYDHISHSRQEKPFYEVLFQIGNRDDTHCGTEAAAIAVKVLQEFMEDFQKRNPHIRIFNAVIHLDEETPHVHIDFVPFATGQKRGLSTRNSLTKALEQQGFKGEGKLNTATKLWIEEEKRQLSEVMRRYDIEWEQLGTHEPHLSVLDYKKKQREREVLRLENKVECTEQILHWREELLGDVERHIDRLDGEYQEKKSEMQQLDAVISEKSAELAETETVLAAQQEIVAQSAEKVRQIETVDAIKIGKTIVSGKVTLSPEDYEELSGLAKKQIAAEHQEQQLTEENQSLKDQNAALSKENEKLRKENSLLRSMRQSLEHLRTEMQNLQRKYDRVLEFIEQLGLKERLREFLHPQKKSIRR